jgi:hypothetical protein
LDRNLRPVFLSSGIPTSRVVFAFQTAATGSRCALGAAFIDAPVTPFSVERAIALNYIIDDAAALTIFAAGKRYRRHIPIHDADAVVL